MIALAQMNELTTQVSTGAREISTGREAIADQTTHLREISDQVRHSILETQAGVREINRSVNEVATMGGENRELVSSLIGMVGSFRVSDTKG